MRRPVLRWLALVAVAAILNVPFAVTRIYSRTAPKPQQLRKKPPPSSWPSWTPHKTAWPAPQSYDVGTAFGARLYDVRSRSGQDNYTMDVQHLGWPLPVLEIKQMWWNWNNPTLKGPESDPRPSLLPLGLILNPLIVGSGLYAVLFLPWDVFVLVRGFRRLDRLECYACGYDLRGNVEAERCPECGLDVPERTRGVLLLRSKEDG